MSPEARNTYFGRVWPAVCRVKRWAVKDDARRRAFTAEAMEFMRCPPTDSLSGLGPDETTALFVYARHVAAPDDFNAAALALECQRDYRTFNRARTADWHERKLYGRGKNKLNRQRFGGATSAAGGPLDSLDPDEVRKRHMTMASRHQKAQRMARANCPISQVEAKAEADEWIDPDTVPAPAAVVGEEGPF